MMQQMSKGDMNIPGMDQMFGSGVKGKLRQNGDESNDQENKKKRKNGNKMKKQLRYRLRKCLRRSFSISNFYSLLDTITLNEEVVQNEMSVE